MQIIIAIFLYIYYNSIKDITNVLLEYDNDENR